MVTVAEAKKIEWIEVVDASGDPINGIADPVPSHWLGTDLLPEGTKKAPATKADKGNA